MPCLYAPWPGRLTQMYVLIVQLYFRDTGADLARKAAIEWFRGQAPSCYTTCDRPLVRQWLLFLGTPPASSALIFLLMDDLAFLGMPGCL